RHSKEAGQACGSWSSPVLAGNGLRSPFCGAIVQRYCRPSHAYTPHAVCKQTAFKIARISLMEIRFASQNRNFEPAHPPYLFSPKTFHTFLVFPSTV
ncbi:MAG: hypothetical protein J1F60_09695, partial [Oscillospiraceae bacterium]|nr:hypothetical protein [Oscillospiraceae bacterium]